MPGEKNRSLKKPDVYEESVGRKGGEATDYEERTVDELKDRAKELGIEDYSDKDKDELIDLIRNH